MLFSGWKKSEFGSEFYIGMLHIIPCNKTYHIFLPILFKCFPGPQIAIASSKHCLVTLTNILPFSSTLPTKYVSDKSPWKPSTNTCQNLHKSKNKFLINLINFKVLHENLIDYINQVKIKNNNP